MVKDVNSPFLSAILRHLDVTSNQLGHCKAPKKILGQGAWAGVMMQLTLHRAYLQTCSLNLLTAMLTSKERKQYSGKFFFFMICILHGMKNYPIIAISIWLSPYSISIEGLEPLCTDSWPYKSVLYSPMHYSTIWSISFVCSKLFFFSETSNGI